MTSGEADRLVARWAPVVTQLASAVGAAALIWIATVWYGVSVDVRVLIVQFSDLQKDVAKWTSIVQARDETIINHDQRLSRVEARLETVEARLSRLER